MGSQQPIVESAVIEADAEGVWGLGQGFELVQVIGQEDPVALAPHVGGDDRDAHAGEISPALAVVDAGDRDLAGALAQDAVDDFGVIHQPLHAGTRVARTAAL